MRLTPMQGGSGVSAKCRSLMRSPTFSIHGSDHANLQDGALGDAEHVRAKLERGASDNKPRLIMRGEQRDY